MMQSDFKGDPEKKYKVTIEHPDFDGKKLVFEMEKSQLILEEGQTVPPVKEAGEYGVTGLFSRWKNGQKRAIIKLWEGCETYESFTTKE
jgi:hypothetical protein